MKRIISFTCAVLLTAVSCGFVCGTAVAEELNESVTEATSTLGMPQAQEAKPNQAVASNVAPTTQPARRSYTRQEIRNMNILDRPNRPGHFYGNAVRRRHGR